MSENELGARLVIDHDKSAAAATKKALGDLLKAEQDLLKATAAANDENLLAVDIAKDQAAAEKAAADAKAKATAAAKAQADATKTVVDFMKDLDRQKALENLAAKWARVAKATKDAADAQDGLQKELAEMNASQGEIQSTTGLFAAGGGGRNALARAGSEIRNLPSVQTGLGFGTDAVGNLLRVSGAVTGVIQSTGAVAAATTALTPLLGAQAAATTAVAGAAAAFLIPLAAIGLAIKAVADEAARQAEVVNATVDAQREVGQQIAQGLTSEDALGKLEELKKLRDDESARLTNLQSIYKQNIDSQGALSGVIKVVSGAEDALAGQIEKGKGLVTDYETQIASLTNALDDGTLAANDAAEAEKKLAEERTKATLDAADAAGRELQAQQKALNSTEEQNKARLKSIEDERAVIERQLESLRGSGDDSEAVQEKIASLNAELQRLGSESAFIEDTALAISRQRDAEKKMRKEIEDLSAEAVRKEEEAGRKRYEAGVKYSNALIDIATRAADAAADAYTKLQDGLAKQETDFNRDIYDLSIKAGQKRLEDQLKQQETEANGLREHQRKLEGIRDEAILSEEDELRKRNFLAAALIREKANREMEAENRGFETKEQEAISSADAAAARELRELENTRNARLLALQRQNEDAKLAYDNDLRNAQTASERARRDALTAKNRELQIAQQTADEVLKIKQRQAELEMQIVQGALDGIMSMANASQSNATPNGFGGDGNSNVTNNNQRSIGSITMPFQTNASPEVIQRTVLRTLGAVGIVK